MNTCKFFVSVGISEGYFHKNKEFNILEINKLWQDEAEIIYKSDGIYISAIANYSYAVYSKNWGCPESGEKTVSFSGSANPEFINDINKWKETVLKICRKMKEELRQSTITVEFVNCEIFYLK